MKNVETLARFAVIAVLAAGTALPAHTASMPEGRMRKTPLENFTLHSEFEISKEDVLAVRRHLTNARRSIGRDFSFYPETKYDVILAKRETFHAYTSTPEQVAGLFDGSIHIPLPSQARSERFVMAVLWHEYTHAVVSEISKNRCPNWLNEGFAVYEEASIEPSNLRHLREAYALKPGKLPLALDQIGPAIEALRSNNGKNAAIAYEQAYVFVDYLFSRYSRSNVNQFLRELGRGQPLEAALKNVFHITPKETESLWLEHLKKKLG